MTRTDAAAAVPVYRPGLAAIWMLGAIVAFSLMAVSGRMVTQRHDVAELLLYRSVFSIAIVLGAAWLCGRVREITTRRMDLHVARNVCHLGGQGFWYWALTMIPLAQLTALEFTSPIWVALLAPLVVGERLTWGRLGAVLLGFAGVLIVVRPDPAALDIGALAAAASAIGFAGSALFTRRLLETETTTCILFWLAVLQTPMALAAAGLDGQILLPDADTLPWLVLIAFAGLTAHFCITMGLSLAPASVVMPLDFARLPVFAVVGWALYGEALELWIVLGAAVILIANLLNIRLLARETVSAPR